ncbi:hypothetical protein WISP_38464 [Willisornis vidua]|uniref:Uncharacterized protein n=1 Tax=Willisornis vidua TaxID=1566151 RepID=A0ABQ9DNS9_9PASS|nr:hypothetical protein WISP_38464 [Willisornis vidua]
MLTKPEYSNLKDEIKMAYLRSVKFNMPLTRDGWTDAGKIKEAFGVKEAQRARDKSRAFQKVEMEGADWGETVVLGKWARRTLPVADAIRKAIIKLEKIQERTAKSIKDM